MRHILKSARRRVLAQKVNQAHFLESELWQKRNRAGCLRYAGVTPEPEYSKHTLGCFPPGERAASASHHRRTAPDASEAAEGGLSVRLEQPPSSPGGTHSAYWDQQVCWCVSVFHTTDATIVGSRQVLLQHLLQDQQIPQQNLTAQRNPHSVTSPPDDDLTALFAASEERSQGMVESKCFCLFRQRPP